MDKLYQYCVFFLGINAPIRFEYREKIWKGAAGVHWAMVYGNGKIKYHVIKISSSLANSSDTCRYFDSVLAHEFVHAWQAEYKPWKKKSHNKYFQDMAMKLEKFLNSEGFDIKGIYIPEHDKH